MINNRKSPIQDDYIEKYLAEKELNLTATLDAKAACRTGRNFDHEGGVTASGQVHEPIRYLCWMK